MKVKTTLALILGTACALGGCNTAKANQNDTQSISLIRQGTTRLGLIFCQYHSEQLPGAYLDYGCDNVVDWIFPRFDVSYRRGETPGTEEMFENADREVTDYTRYNRVQ